jgi:hypothetical protein
LIATEYHAVGIFPAMPASPSPLYQRVIGNPDREDWLLESIRPAALHLLVQKALYKAATSIVPPQYAIFDVVGRPATLFSFNLDGLAKSYCGDKHVVIEAHGSIDPFWFDRTDWETWREAVVAFDVQLPDLMPKLLPSPEPRHTTESHSYLAARRLFQRAPAVLFGYSFGNRGGRFDDAESWEFFIDLLKVHPRPVFVLPPVPEALAYLLRQRLSSRHVFGLPVRWEIFTSLLVLFSNRCQRLPSHWSNERIDLFIYKCTLAGGLQE